VARVGMRAGVRALAGSARVSEGEAADAGVAVTEAALVHVLETEFAPQELRVEDVSGGCGAMFTVHIVSEAFEGMPMVQQHRLVNSVLKDQIAAMHGIVLNTAAPKAE